MDMLLTMFSVAFVLSFIALGLFFAKYLMPQMYEVYVDPTDEPVDPKNPKGMTQKEWNNAVQYKLDRGNK